MSGAGRGKDAAPPAPDSARLLADVLKEQGHKLIDRTVGRVLPGAAAATPPPEAPTKPSSPAERLARRVAGAALMRIASASVPGAILVGGGLVAAHLHRRQRARRAREADQG
ncbi:MAG TPA: hypothetical protein VFF98_00415 [Novosphingobium sp.]|nr:hypothetical protein [Novosphingobium sp.]